MATNGFIVIVKATLDNNTYEYKFDITDDVIINSRSSLTSHPLVNGDIAADHMYREPITLSFSGSFGLHGNKRYTYEGSSDDRLANIQTIFERIKNEGILCSIYKINDNDTSSMRFLQRDNMALTNISWTEKQNSMNFTFLFTEVLFVDIEAEPVVDSSNIYLPTFVEPEVKDFTDLFINWYEVEKTLITVMQELNLVSPSFLNTAASIAANVAVSAAFPTSRTLSSGLSILLNIFSTPTNVVSAKTNFISNIFSKIFSSNKTSENTSASQPIYNTSSNPNENVRRTKQFAIMLGKVKEAIEYLENHIKVYAIPQNIEQSCITHIDNSYYSFTFTINNSSVVFKDKQSLKTISTYSLVVRDIDDKVIKTIPTLTALTDISQCNKSNYIFKTPNNYYVYILNTKLVEAEKNSLTQKEIDNNVLSDLKNYVILVSQIEMWNFNEVLRDIIFETVRTNTNGDN